MNKAIFSIFFVLIIFTSQKLLSQYEIDGINGCNFDNTQSQITGPYKPIKTPNSFINIIIVYVQFAGETLEAGNSNWPVPAPPNNPVPPDYFGDLISEDYNPQSDFWTSYDPQTEPISSWFCEVSRGDLHVIGKEFHVVLDNTYRHYQNLPYLDQRYKEAEINKEICDKLTAQQIPWSEFDNWTLDPQNQTFTNDPDGIIDMIYKVHRNKYSGLFTEADASGYAYLGYVYDGQNHLSFQYKVDTENNKYVYGGYPLYSLNQTDGSGLTVTGNSVAKILTKNGVLARIFHEHGHWFFGSNHSSYGKMGGGGDFFFDPWERIKLDYITPHTSVNDNNPYEVVVLDDYSARSTGTHILKVQMGYSEFLIANRRGISPWDNPMAGDTNAFRDSPHPDYGRGIYIYHNNTYNYPNTQFDIECADGQWKWEQDGHWAPDWDLTNAWLPLLKRTDVVYDRSDDGITRTTATGSDAWGKDGLDIAGLTTENPPKPQGNWFSVGQNGTVQFPIGKDKIYTNDDSYYTSREFWSDRWDAWDLGYNNIISPYSSPNTRTWAHHQSGVYIWISDYNTQTKQTTIKIYRDDRNTGGWDEDDILEVTPPSKPMGIKTEECAFSNGHFRPKISWVHNMEPDMIRGGGLTPEYKRYKIYRSVADDMTKTPPDAYRYPENIYSYVTTVDILSSTTPTFVDDNIISGCALPDGPCPPNCWIIYPVRYRVQAVDMFDDESVLSDFANTTGIKTVSGDPGGEEGDDNPGYDGEVPTSYSLYQNYPNPFNPTTNIQFDLPKEGFVSIKIYDMLGKEIATLVNEFRNAGSYIVGFNGSNLSSGIYYYKIKAGTFEATKRMVLIK